MKFPKRKAASPGYSIVEVIIAMTVITIVTITAIMIASMSTEVVERSLVEFDAITYTDSIIECYMFSENQTEFEASLITMNLYDVSKDDNRGDNIYQVKKDACIVSTFYSNNYVRVMVYNTKLDQNGHVVSDKLIYENFYRKVQ